MSEQEENVESEKLAEDIRQIKETRPPSMSISYLPLLLSSRIGA